MNYLGRVIGNLKGLYSGINSATLTGAIDVIVVEQEDGTFKCSPFHVRFGKLGVLRSREKVVDIELNGVPVPIRMKLGDSGEAFFVQAAYDFDSDDENLATSPLPASPQLSDGEISPQILMRRNVEEARLNNNNNNDLSSKSVVVGDVPTITSPGEVVANVGVNESLPKEITGSNKGGDDSKSRKRRKKRRRNQGSKSSIVVDPSYAVGNTEPAAAAATTTTTAAVESQEGIFKMDEELNAVTHALETLDLSKEEHTQNVNQSRQKYLRDFYSDTEIDATTSPNITRPTTPIQSDSEYEIKKIQKGGGDEQLNKWHWGELPSTGNAPATAPMGPQASSSTSAALIQVVQDKSSTDDNPLSSDDEGKRTENKSVLGTMFSLLTKAAGTSHSGATNETSASEIYLDDLNLEKMDPEVAALYFPNFGRDLKEPPRREHDEDVESGRGSSVNQSPAPGSSPKSSHVAIYMDDQHRQVQDEQLASTLSPSKFEAISICGSNLALFEQSQLTYDELVENPEMILNTPPESIVVKLDGQLVPWSAALPQLLSTTFFKRPLPPPLQDRLTGQYIKKEDHQKDGQSSDLVRSDSVSSKDPNAKKTYSWFPWGRKSTANEGELESDVVIPTSSASSSDADKLPIHETEVKTTSSNESSEPLLQEDVAITPVNQPVTRPEVDGSNFLNKESSSSTSSSDESEGGGGIGGTEDEGKMTVVNRASRVPPIPSPKPIPPPINITSTKINVTVNIIPDQPATERYKKSLRLTSEQIAALGLRYGQNEAVFSVTTAYQGTTVARCHIYLWRYDDRVVVSDIDGTITKSDVLGHILPIIGQAWAQSGVAQLFTQIQANGYKMLYLSARAIGQAATTREYLRSIRQGDVTLPDGPLLLNPTSLMSALHREVIEKKPEEFKIACLRDVQTLFPTNPLYAGYGNKINDVWAYRAVDIAISRIFTINHKGELRHALTSSFQSSYTSLVELAEFMFPPYKAMHKEEERDKSTHAFNTTDGFSSFEYWRNPIPELPGLNDDPWPSTVVPHTSH